MPELAIAGEPRKLTDEDKKSLTIAGPPRPLGQAPPLFGQPRAMSIPPTDPLTGRQQMAGRTMTGRESLRYAADTALTTLPTIGAIAAAQMTPAGPEVDALLAARFGGPLAGRLVGFIARTLSVGAGGEIGGAVEQTGRAATGIGAPKNVKEALQKSHEAGLGMMEMQIGGEAAGGLAASLAPGIKAGAEGFTSIMRRSIGGRFIQGQADKATILANSVVVEKANAAATEALAALGPKVAPEQMSARAEIMMRRTRDAMNAQARGIYDMQKSVLAGKTADLVPAAKAIIRLEETIPRYKGTFKPLTSPDPEWAELVERAKQFSKEKTVKTKTGLLDETGQPIIRTGTKPPVDVSEDARALVDARATINKRLWDLKEAERAGEPVNREYIDGMQRLVGIHDDLIRKKLKEIGGKPAEQLVDVAKNFFNAESRINEQMFYRALRKDPSRVVDMILPDSGKGDGVKTVAHLEAAAKAANMQEFLPEVRRRWLEGLITDKDGKIAVFDLEPALAKYGRTAQAMMRSPEDKATLARLRKIAEERMQLKDTPKTQGYTSLDWMIHGAITSAVYAGMGAGHGVGGAVGAIGATIGGPAMMVMIANNPRASTLFRQGMRAMAEAEPSASADIARAVSLAWKGGKAQYLALEGIGQMVKSHGQEQQP